MKMWLMLLLSLVLAPAVIAADDSIGQVNTIEGSATATGVDKKERKLELKSDIFLNDRIVTGVGAKIQIKFADDTEIFQGEKSEMTIDEYVYDPKAKKESSCSVKMAKGVFRTITGTITDMNPERFKVQTKMATIGIRGCELGFRLQKNREDIYIINLPEGDSIIIEKLVAGETGKGGVISVVDRMMSVVNDGVAVSISPSSSLSERPVTPSESRQLMQDSSPSKSGGGSVGMDVVSAKSAKNAIDSAVDKSSEKAKLADLAAQAAAKTQPASESKDYTDLSNFVQPTTAPYVAPPTGPSLVLNGGAPGNDWEWGLWSDGSGSPVGANRIAPGAAIITPTEYATIVAAIPTSRILTIPSTGFGDCAAVVMAGSYKNTLSGASGVTGFEVEIGMTATPRWGGTFNMSSGGDSLVFVVDRTTGGGSIDSTGKLTLNTMASYQLIANGTTYLNPTTRSVNGSLIKPGFGTPPISGAAGTFSFQHGTAASVNGVFGVDLQ